MTQLERIVTFLREHPHNLYTAREIAAALITQFPQDYAAKRQNPRFANEESFLQQIVAEISSHKDGLAGKGVTWQDRPKPRRYYWTGDDAANEVAADDTDDAEEQEVLTPDSTAQCCTEQDLYPLLIQYLHTELGLTGMRIDEKRSHNSRGAGGNEWLHPDVVALQAVDKRWNEVVRSCVKQSGTNPARLWSFEVKKTLTAGNVRKCFFQAVSNSSWANEGYLVTASLASGDAVRELRMLSALHGIGVIVLNTQDPAESEIFLPAATRPEVDWQSVNRLLVENSDFKAFMECVDTYLKTGRVHLPF